MLMMLLAGFMAWAWPADATAQDNDVMVVEWAEEDGVTPKVDALRNAILGDTLEGGERANPDRIYQLQREGIYYLEDRIANSGYHLRIVGEEGDGRLPFIQMQTRDDGSHDDKIFTPQDDFTLKNVYIWGRNAGGGEPYQTIELQGDEKDYVFDGVVFEHAMWGIIGVNGIDVNLTFRNCTFRNLISDSQPWGGRGFSVWSDINELIVEHNTFLNVTGFPIQVEGGNANHFWLNHNTFVNFGRQLIIGPWFSEAYVSNNLMVNGWYQAEVGPELDGPRDPDQYYAGLINLESMPARYGLDVERTVLIQNNSHFRDDFFEDIYAAVGDEDELRPGVNFNQRTLSFLEDDEAYPNMVLGEFLEGENPDFTNGPTTQEHYQELWDWISAVREGEEVIRPYWPDDSFQWPLPEDLSYSNSTLLQAGFGDYPLGDLNWFPDEYESWKLEQEALADEIKAGAQAEISTELVATIEAEDGVLDGAATVVAAEDEWVGGFGGVGSIEWEIEIAVAGTYDISIRTLSDNPDREQDLIVNDGDVIKIVPGVADEWVDMVIEDIDLVEGTNTIRIEPSWGWQDFASITILDGDQEVATASLDMAELSGVDLECDGDLCASGGHYVELNDTGSLTFNYNAPGDGQYALQLFYMLPEGADANFDVYLNGDLATAITLSGAEQTWLIADVTDLNFDEGNNEIQLRHGNGEASFDYVNLFLFSMEIPTFVDERDDVAGEFRLSQNYPNPFNPTTQIRFELPHETDLSLIVYDLLGRRVATLAEGIYSSGQHTVHFDASHLASGVYLYRIESAPFTQTQKMTLIK